MDPPPTGRDLGVHQGGPVCSQASFLKASFWQKVFENERYLKMFGLLRLAAPSSQVQQCPEGGYGVTQATPRSNKHDLFLPSQRNPCLYGQRHVSTPSTGHHTTDLQKWSHSVSQKLNEFSPALRLENCP